MVCAAGTDMSKHFDILIKFKLRVDAEQFDLQNQEDRTMLCCVVSSSCSRADTYVSSWHHSMLMGLLLSLATQVVHAADLANVSRPYESAAKWAALHAEEQWRQGDTEKTLGVPVSLMCERKQSPTEITQAIGAMQVDFSDYVVLPTWNQLASALGEFPFVRS